MRSVRGNRDDYGLRVLERCVLASLVMMMVFGGPQGCFAQGKQPDTPTNALATPIPYEQGIANIMAQGAARPQAVRPLKPGEIPPAPGTTGGKPVASPSSAPPAK